MRKRLIPVLLLDASRRLVKTVRFGQRTYIGDPFNVIRLFNEKEVDELVVLDIDAGLAGRPPDFGFLRELASECFMPVAYGGGIRSMADCAQLNRLGVEKFVFGHGAFEPGLVESASRSLGSQAIVACVDYVGQGSAARCVIRSGRAQHPLQIHPLMHAKALEAAGAGEIILQSVDRDGTRQGMDLATVGALAQNLSVPLVALGGAGDLGHLALALASGASAVASGSAFSFIGRLRAVLINYPERAEMDAMAGQTE
jgi:cyclase